MNEQRVNQLVELLSEIVAQGGANERTAIYPNAEVIDATPADLPAGYVIVEDDRGFYVPAVLVSGLSVNDGDKVNLMYIKGTEPIAFQHGTYSVAGGYILESIIDAKGDLIVGTADNTPARLAVGSNDEVLTADSGEATGVKWAPAGGGSGALELIGGSVLGAPASSFTFTSIAGTYASLELRCFLRSDYSGAQVEYACLQFATGGGGIDTGNNYRYFGFRETNSGGSPTTDSSGNSATVAMIRMGITEDDDSLANVFSAVIMDIPGYAQAYQKSCIGRGHRFGPNATNTDRVIGLMSGNWTNTGVIDSVRVLPWYGSNWDTGSSAYLYGRNSS